MSAEPNFSTSENASAKPPPALKTRRLSTRQRQQSNFRLGEVGETRATNFLIALHYQILDRNVRVGTHEIDIIAKDPRTKELVFVEVKTRSTASFGNPSAAVTKSKLDSLHIVAREYQRRFRNYSEFRFDIIAVLPSTIEHYQNITWNF